MTTPRGGRDIGPEPLDDELAVESPLRPRTLDEYIGQEQIRENLRVQIEAARARGDVLDHVLLCGPPGLGKTSLAHVIANELGVNLHVSSGPAIDHKGMLASLLTSLGEGDALLFHSDETHRFRNPGSFPALAYLVIAYNEDAG